ncbi:helix-turn-helix domain-containing protein [Paraconexibacter algicola]|uniref:helix-turn-helix domain-containing protein n=1 Tax=Paraconexibacter algicola TaxID=2133960 RepID=UPI0011B2257E|nr:helix-turn-helix domain-containing protein [Paraconexibacter algicola]
MTSAVVDAARFGDAEGLGRALADASSAPASTLSEIIVALGELDALVRDLEGEHGLGAVASSWARAWAAALEDRQVALQMREATQRRRAEASVVVEKVLDHLREERRPMRSGEIADELDLDIAQVSRALRYLQNDDLVKAVAAPDGCLDGRARWYVAR